MIPNLRVLTINVHKGFSTFNRKFVLHELRDEIRKTSADILFLQEVTGENLKKQKKHSRWPVGDHAKFLADDIWKQYVYGKNAVYLDGHHGNAILSKHAIIESEKIDISTNRFEQRGFLYCTIQIDGWAVPLHCICVHLGLLSGARKKQMKKINDYIDLTIPASHPVIVAGDFNDWNENSENNFAIPAGFKEVFMEKTGKSAKTFPAWIPLLKLDRIYCRGLVVKDCRVHDHKQWKKLSDHLAIFAEVQCKLKSQPKLTKEA